MKARIAFWSVVLALATSLQAAAATQNEVTYSSGGIGRDEALALEREAGRYPLSLVFEAGKNNEFLADVKVTIRDKAGNVVLDAVSGGPIMLIKLPAGKYRVTAVAQDAALTRVVHVRPHASERVTFHWAKA